MDTAVIRLLGDPVLRTPTAPVTAFGPDLVRLVTRMTRVMKDADGVGLAANQIGVGLRVFVYDLRDGRAGHVVNPMLHVSPTARIVAELEGCLSVPGRHQPTPRAECATVRGVDLGGAPIEVSGDGLLVRCLQHEVDHLDGLLYLDRLAPRIRRTVVEAFLTRSAADV